VTATVNQDDDLPAPTASEGRRGLRVAVLYNAKENAARLNGRLSRDVLAELDSMRTVEDYVVAIRALGHAVVAFEGGADLPQRLAAHPVDIVFNTCEGLSGESREAQVPALLEMLGVPYSGSRVLALALTLDKAMTKRVLAHHGLPTPPYQEFCHPRQPLDPALRFPLFVKPNREGTGIGIHADSVVQTEAALREKVAELMAAYDQTVLVEEFIEGRDVTCGLVGNLGPATQRSGSADDVHVFPISEVNHAAYPPGTEPFYSYKLKVELADAYQCLCPAPIPDEVAAEVRRLTVETYRACRCLDVARVDFRLDARNNWRPTILEINALPGMARDSDLTRSAYAEGWTHPQLIQAVFNAAVDRHRLSHSIPSALPTDPLIPNSRRITP
jgi:D-alanine-D-alanine ligase